MHLSCACSVTPNHPNWFAICRPWIWMKRPFPSPMNMKETAPSTVHKSECNRPFRRLSPNKTAPSAAHEYLTNLNENALLHRQQIQTKRTPCSTSIESERNHKSSLHLNKNTPAPREFNPPSEKKSTRNKVKRIKTIKNMKPPPLRHDPRTRPAKQKEINQRQFRVS